MSLDGFAMVVGVEEILQGLKGHPLCRALLLSAGGVDIDHPRVFQPILPASS